MSKIRKDQTKGPGGRPHTSRADGASDRARQGETGQICQRWGKVI